MSEAVHTVLYDSDCPLCTFQMKGLTWLDWLNRTRFLALKEEQAQALVPNVSREDLVEAIHCVTPEGRIYRGARAIRFLGMQMPLLVPVAIVLWFPGVIWIAEHAYMFISHNRHFFSKIFGCKGACAIMPQRERSQDATSESESSG